MGCYSEGELKTLGFKSVGQNVKVSDKASFYKIEQISPGDNVRIGSGSIILPGITLGKGVAVGALSLVKNDMPEFVICAGQPAKIIKARKRDLLSLQIQLEANG